MKNLALTHRVREAHAGTDPHPALVLLHGLGTDENDMMGVAAYVDPRMYVVSVRAPNAYRWGGYAWYDPDAEGPGLGGPRFDAALSSLHEFVQDLPSVYPVDSRQIFFGGFSLGAAMSGAYTLLHPEQVRGAIMVGGFLPPDAQPPRYQLAQVKGKPVFQAHGARDTVVSVDYARMTRDYLVAAGVELEYREYPIAHEVSLPEMVDLSSWLELQVEAATTGSLGGN